MVVNFIRDRFQQKDNFETLQTKEMLLLKALSEEDFGHELQQISLFFNSDLDKFKLETELKNVAHIVDETQDEIKDATKIIQSLNASQKLLAAEVLKMVQLILLVLATNAVKERSYSTLL